MPNDPDGLNIPGVPREWLNRLVQSDNETDEIIETGTPPQAHDSTHEFGGSDVLDVGDLSSESAPEPGDIAYAQEDDTIFWGALPTNISDIGQWKYAGVQASDIDPGTANFKVNNADHLLVTEAWSSNVNRDGLDVSDLVNITAGDRFICQQSGNSSRIVVYTAQGAVTQHGTYFSVDLVYHSETASFSGFVTQWYTIGYQATAPVTRHFEFNGILPATGEDRSGGFNVGDIIIDTLNDDAYICLNDTVGAAVWKKITP